MKSTTVCIYYEPQFNTQQYHYTLLYSSLQAENANGNKLSDLVKNCQIINEIKY